MVNKNPSLKSANKSANLNKGPPPCPVALKIWWLTEPAQREEGNGVGCSSKGQRALLVHGLFGPIADLPIWGIYSHHS